MDKSVLRVVQGSRTYGSPSCVPRPAAIFVHFMNAMKFAEYCRRLGIKSFVTLRVRLAPFVALCMKEFDTPQLDILQAWTSVPHRLWYCSCEKYMSTFFELNCISVWEVITVHVFAIFLCYFCSWGWQVGHPHLRFNSCSTCGRCSRITRSGDGMWTVGK